MNDQFDELTRNMAQSITRRGALKKFGIGLAGIVLATLGLASKAAADSVRVHIKRHCHCRLPDYGCSTAECFEACANFCERH